MLFHALTTGEAKQRVDAQCPSFGLRRPTARDRAEAKQTGREKSERRGFWDGVRCRQRAGDLRCDHPVLRIIESQVDHRSIREVYRLANPPPPSRAGTVPEDAVRLSGASAIASELRKTVFGVIRCIF